MADKKQIYIFDRQEVYISYNIMGNDDFVVVEQADGYGGYMVAREKDLVKLEDSYEYRRARERADEIRLITAKAQENLDELAEKIVDKALKSLASRIKLNVLLGKSGNNAWAVMISDELEKLVRESGKKLAGKPSSTEIEL